MEDNSKLMLFLFNGVLVPMTQEQYTETMEERDSWDD